MLIEKDVISIHCSEFGTYHPDPNAEIAWTINDVRGFLDVGPQCDKCGACECESDAPMTGKPCEQGGPDVECVGLSFAYVCLDGGEALCEDCASEEDLRVTACSCGQDNKEKDNNE